MLDRYKTSLGSQIILLSALTTASVLLTSVLKHKPQLRFGLDNIALGVSSGCIIGIAVLLLKFFLILASPKFKQKTEYRILQQQKLGPLVFLGSVLCDAAGLEMLLRGVVFGGLLSTSASLAFAVSFFLSFLVDFRRGELSHSLFRALEGTAYAIVYYYSKSLFAIFLTRACSELLGSGVIKLILSSSKIISKAQNFFQIQVLHRAENCLRKLPLLNRLFN